MANINGVQSFAPTNIPTTTETVVLTFSCPPENSPTGQGIQIDANATVLAGTAATALVGRVRIGSVTGPVVGGIIQAQTVAGSTTTLSGSIIDATPVYPVGQTYVLTVTQVAATGNGTMVYAGAFTNPCSAIPG